VVRWDSEGLYTVTEGGSLKERANQDGMK
jgi:hypothetical protein